MYLEIIVVGLWRTWLEVSDTLSLTTMPSFSHLFTALQAELSRLPGNVAYSMLGQHIQDTAEYMHSLTILRFAITTATSIASLLKCWA